MLQPAFKQKETTMSKAQAIKIEDILLDYSIYPRSNIDHKRVSLFEENMRDGFKFEPIHLQEHLDGKDDLPKCKELQWGIRTWDNWKRTDCDKRFGDEWPGRIPAQLFTLYPVLLRLFSISDMYN
jgi:hypothetical protein